MPRLLLVQRLNVCAPASARVWESHYYPVNYRVSGGRSGKNKTVAPNCVSPELVYAVPNDASVQLLNSETMDGHIALVDRGKVPLVTKVRRAQEVSGILVVVVDCSAKSIGRRCWNCYR